MTVPDFQAFISDLQNTDMLGGDLELQIKFRNRYRAELALVTLMLNDIDVTGGEYFIHPTPPDACDFCEMALKHCAFFVDGRTRSGPAANMCPECYYKNGTGIGWGTGQLYRKHGAFGWQCIAGSRVCRDVDPDEFPATAVLSELP